MSMSVEDLTYSLGNACDYQFEVDDILWGELDTLPVEILSKKVVGWQCVVEYLETEDDTVNLIGIYTCDYMYDQIIPGLENVGFSHEQLQSMMNSGIPLSNIVDMALTMDAVKSLYVNLGYTERKVRPVIYDYYTNKLQERLNSYIAKDEVE